MLNRLIKQLNCPDGTADTDAVLDALRPRLIVALNAVTSELVADATGEDADAAIRASRMAGALLMTKSLTVVPDGTGSVRGAGPDRSLHAHLKREAVGSMSHPPEPRAHHAASRKTLRALAELCLRAPRGSLGWSAALWSLTHPKMPIELQIDELTAVTRACAAAFPPLGVRALGALQHVAADAIPADLDPRVAREVEREAAGAQKGTRTTAVSIRTAPSTDCEID